MIVFDDGTNGVIDFEEYLTKGPVFTPLKDLDFFILKNGWSNLAVNLKLNPNQIVELK